MKPLKLKVRFLTPAFLGDAEQKGVWRVPPFKAQLRYWWRFVLDLGGKVLCHNRVSCFQYTLL